MYIYLHHSFFTSVLPNANEEAGILQVDNINHLPGLGSMALHPLQRMQ